MEQLGDWIRFPDTIHEMLSHLPQTLGMVFEQRLTHIVLWQKTNNFFLEKNGGRGLKMLSEENLEKEHKVVR